MVIVFSVLGLIWALSVFMLRSIIRDEYERSRRYDIGYDWIICIVIAPIFLAMLLKVAKKEGEFWKLFIQLIRLNKVLS